MPTSPTYATPPDSAPASAAVPPVITTPTQPPLVPTPTFAAGVPTTYPTYVAPTATTTTPATTVSPTPTPTHAAKCAGSPTAAEILTLITGKPGIPDKTLRVATGPFCESNWSFSTVEVAGEDADEQDPLMVVSFGSGTTLQLVTAGNDVCNDPVQTSAPAGIRVLACGF